MIDSFIIGIDAVFSGYNFLYLVLGVMLGTFVGVLPGLGPTATIAILLPTTFSLGPVTGIIMLAGIYYGSQYGGSTTAILLNIPGENSSVMTCIDGNKMAKQGRAGVAIMAAAVSSFIAGIIMAIAMALLSPPLSEIAFKFGPAEYALLMFFGFISVTVLTETDIIKGLALACMGVLFGIIGTDINSGIDRFTLGSIDLVDGVGFSIIAIGLFAFGEIIKNLLDSNNATNFTKDIKLIPSLSDVKRIIPSSLRGTAVGGLLGLLPGGGITVSSYAAYTLDKQVSKNKQEFGEGAIEGVAAPEAANNASAQAGFIPLMSIGLPENAVMALMLGAMIVAGIAPGPMVIQNHPDLFWGLIVSMLIGNFLLLILNFPLVRLWVSILKIPYHLLYPSIIFICFIGIYSIGNNINDIFILSFFILLGYILLLLDLSPVTFILGFVLGPMLEDNFRRALAISQGDFSIFVNSNISVFLLIMIFSFLSFGIYRLLKTDK